MASADLDLEIAEEWSAVDQEAWERLDKEGPRRQLLTNKRFRYQNVISMRLRAIHASKVNPVRLFSIEDLSDIVVFAGPNGVGKTRLILIF